MKGNLINLFWKILCITIIIGIVICCIAWLWDKSVVNVGFVKDVYSGLITAIAPLIAIYLFTDWKKQLRYTKQVDYILEIRKNLRELKNILFELRNLKCLDTTISIEDLDSRSNDYLHKLNDFDKYLQNIENLFSDLNFIIQKKGSDKIIINNQIAILKGISIQSRNINRRIYQSIKEKTPIKMTEKLARSIAAYDAMYDQDYIKTETGKIYIDQTKLILGSFKELNNMCLEAYEKGASKNKDLLERLLDK